MQLGTTIAAIATAIVPEQGSIGIVRLSGPEAVAIAQQIFRGGRDRAWSSHRILYGHVVDPASATLVDEVLLLVMLAPRSYTKEDVIEFHCHGGLIPVQQVLQLCLAQGAKLAQPGEFTLRAVLNGRLDVIQAESVADLVGAKSPQTAQMALAGLQGKLAQPIRAIRSACLDMLAEIEARLDFADDLPPLGETALQTQLAHLLQQLGEILSTANRGELLRTGLKIAIVGRPNVGKSSLLNAWSRTDRAIVTNLPGTTRDVVESSLVVGGIPIQVLDTAGMRDTEDQVEKIGVERSRQAASHADLVLLVIDAQTGWTQADQVIYEPLKSRPLLLVVNKIDLATPDLTAILEQFPCHVKTAAAQGTGITELEQAILEQVHQGQVTAANLDIAINQRQAATLTQAWQSLNQVQQAIAEQLPLDFWTIDLRAAITALGQVTGEELTESMLERIFSQFCIGK
ncbi:tRNA uridine-5-carboxymethylaminomethyl(34) synthesis GTPase MnmE [Synechococcus sp. PCC 6312]|uniref:tRNA uridine-5-carboxymethylaminomethyl(34) synthesis GTPase MnmE n=1 Tax=Synechococcus sp. (strain ATCC 27167 / PCC 6312) TaxID=195253 RepID=UPI00155B3B69